MASGLRRSTRAAGDRVDPGSRAGARLAARGLHRSRPSLERRNAELKALDAVGAALGSSLVLRTLLEQALGALLDAWHFSAACVALCNWETQEIEAYWGRRGDAAGEAAFRRLDLLSLSAGPSGAEVRCPLPEQAREHRSPPGERLLAGPIAAGGETVGVLAAWLPAGQHSLRQERRLLGAIGRRLACAATNARLYERARREADRLAAVNAVGSAVRGSLRIPRVLDEALQQLLAVTDLELAAVFVPGERAEELTVAAQAGLTRALCSRLARRVETRLGEMPEMASAAGHPIVEEDLPAARFGRKGRQRAPRCLMHIPLHSPARALGVLSVGSYTQPHFAPHAVDLLLGMGSQISLALENARLYEETQLGARRLEAINAELARANEALREAIRSKDQFLANVTHELKRPLAPARLVVETLLDTPPGKLSPQRQEKLLRNALSNLDNMNTLVSDLLDAVRLQRHAQQFLVERVDLRAVTRRSLAGMRPLAETHRIQLHAIIPSGPVDVQGDPEALARVLSNLLSNGIKFNREGGSVLVQVEASGDRQAVLSVTDTGIGIPPHARPHVFDLFYQADSSSTRKHEGLGLGLYIAREIVERHGGQIHFDTEEGIGTTFTVTLPLA